MIKVQYEDFSLEKETRELLDRNNNVGAVSSFIGIVRDKAKEKDLISMTLCAQWPASSMLAGLKRTRLSSRNRTIFFASSASIVGAFH